MDPQIHRISLQQPTEEDLKILQSLLETYPQQKLWQPTFSYPLQYDNKSLGVMFDFPLLKRARKEGKPQESRYEVISNTRFNAKQDKSSLFCIDCMYVWKEESLQYKKKTAEKERVVKYRNRDPRQELWKDYFFSQQADSQLAAAGLHAKIPDYVQGAGFFMVMRHLKGEDLHQIINRDVSPQRPDYRPLSLEQRLEISLGILQQVQKILDANILHRDIKPENIKVDLQNMTVTLFDYEYARFLNTPDDLPLGTTTYAAPEILYPKQFSYLSSEKSEVYSLGRVLYLLWVGDTRSYQIFNYSQLTEQNEQLRFFPTLKALNAKIPIGDEGDCIREDEKKMLLQMLQQMLDIEQPNRPTVQQCLDFMQGLSQSHQMRMQAR